MYYGYIGSLGYEDLSSGYLTIDSGIIDIDRGYIGAGNGGAIGDITINNGMISVDASTFPEYDGAAIGAGIASISLPGENRNAAGQASCVNSITINGGIVTAVAYKGAGIGSGEGLLGKGSSATDGMSITKNITINGGMVTATSQVDGAGIGSGYSDYGPGNSVVGNITINGGTVTATAVGLTAHDAVEAIGAGGLGIAGTITYNNGVAATVTGSNTSFPYTVVYTGNNSGGSSIVDNATSEYTYDKLLRFQVGTKSNQTIDCFINDMHAEAMGLSDADILTRAHASAAIDVMDKALTYALDENTRIGAYISRMEYTSANLVTASENVMSAESVVRDADMAKTMTEYAKNNVLSQAAQSMLAQANQESSSVLSLLK